MTRAFLAHFGSRLEALDRFGGGGKAGRQIFDHKLDPGQALDVAQIATLGVGAEGNRDPGRSGARGAADAVDILFGNFGQIEIDHVADPGNVDPARRDVGRDQHFHLAGAEHGDGPFALRLRLVAVDRARGDTGRGQLADDLVGAMLGAAEDERALDRLLLQNHRQQRRLFRLIDEGDALFDALDRGRHRSHRNFGRIGQITVGEFLDRARHGGREEQGLALGRDQSDDPLQCVDEAQIEHLIGFVEDQNFELAKAQRALLDKVEQSARSGDENVETAGDFADALVIGHAAENGADGQLHELAISARAAGDLSGQLTGRSEHQHADLAGLEIFAIGGQPVERWKNEGSGLAGAGLGDAQQVATGQKRRDGLKLDRGRDSVIGVLKRIEHRLGKPECSE